MKLSSLADMRSLLVRWRRFEECLLDGVRWLAYGASIELVFNYIWSDGSGRIREDLDDRPMTIVLRLDGVPELHRNRSGVYRMTG